MLRQPEFNEEQIIGGLKEHFNVAAKEVKFLPIGHDPKAAVYRVAGWNGEVFFLKMIKGSFDDTGIRIVHSLSTQGIDAVIPPMPTSSHELAVHHEGYHWILSPFVDGRTGFESSLSEQQSVRFGQILKSIHSAGVPHDLQVQLRQEDFSSPWCEKVRELDREMDADLPRDKVAGNLIDFWKRKRGNILTLVERTEELGQRLQDHDKSGFVLCHGDIHPGNVMIDGDSKLFIVDWDDPVMAPVERDLMFPGVGLGLCFKDESPEHIDLFYKGYGEVEVNPVLLAYYRNERVVADIVSYGMQLINEEGNLEDRKNGLRLLMGQFESGYEVEVAGRTYEEME
ncbi:aminoglycoside phosphotransferase family protein [Rossellomorea sp. KS-H15a]|uniref:aminoglycoside phosphotransferase family protein n=1 Tax=Rossellomorea sp. KS-H15a TaxID=2963940 RepID=UPI0020C5D186|nr:aminoglycoside phosphotransferase family protein [Rossellomorea sp. KS-H15a]UTE78433.1 aminoglycoside phosphotransferase family protein [Rossellomorea sp. KS-H15a]